MQERANALGRQYLNAVLPIGIQYDEERAELIGSAVLLRIGDRPFVITAGHVADWSERGELMIGGRESFWMLPPLRSSDHPGDRQKDPYDIAFAELGSETAAGLGDVRFLESHELDVNSHAAAVPFYTAIGYPVIHQNYDASRQHFNPLATVFSDVALPGDAFRRISTGLFTAAANVAINFNQQKVVAGDGLLRGLSGGGLWRFESLVDPTASDVLVRITIHAHHHGTKALVATRINAFLAAILHVYPELASHIPASETISVNVRTAEKE